MANFVVCTLSLSFDLLHTPKICNGPFSTAINGKEKNGALKETMRWKKFGVMHVTKETDTHISTIIYYSISAYICYKGIIKWKRKNIEKW